MAASLHTPVARSTGQPPGGAWKQPMSDETILIRIQWLAQQAKRFSRLHFGTYRVNMREGVFRAEKCCSSASQSRKLQSELSSPVKWTSINTTGKTRQRLQPLDGRPKRASIFTLANQGCISSRGFAVRDALVANTQEVLPLQKHCYLQLCRRWHKALWTAARTKDDAWSRTTSVLTYAYT